MILHSGEKSQPRSRAVPSKASAAVPEPAVSGQNGKGSKSKKVYLDQQPIVQNIFQVAQHNVVRTKYIMTVKMPPALIIDISNRRSGYIR